MTMTLQEAATVLADDMAGELTFTSFPKLAVALQYANAMRVVTGECWSVCSPANTTRWFVLPAKV